MSAALKNRSIRWVALLYAAGSTLDWALGISLMVLVYDRTGSPLAAGTMLVCTQVVPAILLFIFGRHTDAWNVRVALGGGFLLQGAAVIGLAVSGASVYAAALLIGLAGVIVRSQLRAGLAQVARGEIFRAGNALLNAIRGTTSLIGPALAAAAIAVAGAETALIGVGALLACAGLFALRAPLVRAGAAAGVSGLDVSGAPAARSGQVTPLLILTGVVIAALSVDEPVLLAYVKDGLGADVEGYAALLTAWGVGMLFGAALFSRLTRHPMLTVFAGAMALSAVAHVGLALAPSLAAAIACSAVGGVANGIDWAALSTAIMERAPIGRESSIASRMEAVATAAPGIGFAVGGALAAAYSPRLVFLVPALAAAIVVAVVGLRAIAHARARFSLSPVLPSEATPSGVI